MTLPTGLETPVDVDERPLVDAELDSWLVAGLTKQFVEGHAVAMSEHASDGTSDDGTYYVRYNFDSSVPNKSGSKLSTSVFIKTSGVTSDIIANTAWL